MKPESIVGSLLVDSHGAPIFLPSTLEIASQSLAALLATWLGLTVVSRAPRERSARVFAWVCLLVLVWSVAILVQRTSDDPAVGRPANALEDVAAYLLPAAVLHVVLAFTTEGPYASWHRGVLALAYAAGGIMGIQQILDPAHPVSFETPRLDPGFISGDALAWAWFLIRVAILLLATSLTASAYLAAGGDRARRGQTMAALVTVVLAAIGGTQRFLPADLAGPRWIGVAIVTAALVAATYAVFGQGVFLSRSAVANAFRTSLLGGMAVAAYVTVLVAVEALVEAALSIDLPVVMALSLVATVALFDPVRDRVRSGIEGRGARERMAAIQLDRALGTGLATQSPQAGIQPAIERLGRFLGFERALVLASDGATLAAMGSDDPEVPVVVRPLVAAGRTVGEARFGARSDGRPYTEREDALLHRAADYIAASIAVEERQAQQLRALEDLAVEHQNLTARGSDLQASLSVEGHALEPLTVYALGPLRVERAGRPIQGWGGPKAGSRQAEAIFAFLFDRGDRGATKDEILEVVWPDVDVPHADLAFHRTLAGLRDVLEPSRPRRSPSLAITFHHDRYHLNPELVAWSDVAEFNNLIDGAGEPADEVEAIDRLHRARDLYRGDFVDDCPFYGESEYVETSRSTQRGRLVDLLVTLGEREEGRGDTMAAASAFRQALVTAGGDCRRADEGLARLGVTP